MTQANKSILKLHNDTRGKTVEEAFKEFLQYCKVKNLSSYTIEFYEDTFKQLTSFLVDPKTSILRNVTKQTFNEFILFLQQKLSNSISINTIIRGNRAFLYYCMRVEYLKQFKIETIKAEKKIKETYTDAELNLLLAKPNIKTCQFSEYRDWVIINYLMATGNRVQSIINIKISDIDLENAFVSVKRTKNKREQAIPLSKTMVRILHEYLSYRKGNSEDFLFCNITGDYLSRNSIIKAIERYNKKRGVMKTSMHLFRHTFAKKWILAGGDIFRLQKILGHSSLEIVKEYVNMFSDDLKRDFDQFNPLEQMTVNNKNIKMR